LTSAPSTFCMPIFAVPTFRLWTPVLKTIYSLQCHKCRCRGAFVQASNWHGYNCRYFLTSKYSIHQFIPSLSSSRQQRRIGVYFHVQLDFVSSSLVLAIDVCILLDAKYVLLKFSLMYLFHRGLLSYPSIHWSWNSLTAKESGSCVQSTSSRWLRL
jgi:hypothetical protein